MKITRITQRNQLKSVELYEGELIETKVARIMRNKEPISDGAPIIYTERKDGVMAGYNIRTDRWDIALEAMDAVNRAKAAKKDGVPEKPKAEVPEGIELKPEQKN